MSLSETRLTFQMVSTMTNTDHDSRRFIDVSIIIPIYNGERWIDGCFNSIMNQTAFDNEINVELSIHNDASQDNTEELLLKWEKLFVEKDVKYTLTKNSSGSPKGVGYAKNSAVNASCGTYLCFQDIDDIMMPDRILLQYNAALSRHNMIIGSKFHRDPPDSTVRYTKWANELTQDQLNIQIYTSHGPTIIMPTWFCHKDIFNRLGGFSEEGKGIPEDLIFFYKHIDVGGKYFRIDKYLLIYSYHQNATTFSISSDAIWDIRVQQLQKDFLPLCKNGFTIWNAGKQGKKFYRSLNDQQKSLVKCFCDVDTRKVGTFYEMYCDTQRKVIAKIPIIHYSLAKPPIIVCVKMDMTDGDFEKNLNSLNLQEGVDYVLFS